MEYLVESHLGGYYISDLERSEIEVYCEQCGDSDTILLSFEDGMLKEALSEYLSKSALNEKEIKSDYESGILKDEMVEDLIFDFDCDRNMIYCLHELSIISNEEKDELLKQINISQKRQLELLKIIIKKLEISNIKVLKK